MPSFIHTYICILSAYGTVLFQTKDLYDIFIIRILAHALYVCMYIVVSGFLPELLADQFINKLLNYLEKVEVLLFYAIM